MGDVETAQSCGTEGESPRECFAIVEAGHAIPRRKVFVSVLVNLDRLRMAVSSMALVRSVVILGPQESN